MTVDLNRLREADCLTHASEFYDEALCFAQMARLYHETGGNTLNGLAWANENYGECKWQGENP